TQTITVGSGPTGIVAGADEDLTTEPFVYVACQSPPSISLISTLTNHLLSSVSLSDAPFGLVVSPGRVYASLQQSNKVAAIEQFSYITYITVGNGPSGMALSPYGDKLYVANQVSGTISVIDGYTKTVISTITLSSNLQGM